MNIIIFLFIPTLLTKALRSKRREVFFCLFQAVEELIILLIYKETTLLVKRTEKYIVASFVSNTLLITKI